MYTHMKKLKSNSKIMNSVLAYTNKIFNFQVQRSNITQVYVMTENKHFEEFMQNQKKTKQNLSKKQFKQNPLHLKTKYNTKQASRQTNKNITRKLWIFFFNNLVRSFKPTYLTPLIKDGYGFPFSFPLFVCSLPVVFLTEALTAKLA